MTCQSKNNVKNNQVLIQHPIIDEQMKIQIMEQVAKIEWKVLLENEKDLFLENYVNVNQSQQQSSRNYILEKIEKSKKRVKMFSAKLMNFKSETEIMHNNLSNLSDISLAPKEINSTSSEEVELFISGKEAKVCSSPFPDSSSNLNPSSLSSFLERPSPSLPSTE